MKKAIAILMLLILCFTMAVTASAETLTDVEYIENEILVDTQFVIDLDDYSGEGPFDFYGVSITSIERSSNFLTAEEELERFTIVAYKITIDSSEDIHEAVETLNNNENIFNASLNVVIGSDDIIMNDPVIVRPVGDVNDDGKLDMFDLVVVKSICFGLQDENSFEYADVNSDGSVNMFDYMTLKTWYFEANK